MLPPNLLNFSRSRNTSWSLVIILLGGLIPQLAVAAIYDRQGRKIPDREVNSDRVNWQLLNTEHGKKYNAVGLIDVDYGVCTGFAIASGNNPQSPAYVVTNAHCQGENGRLPNAREIIVNRASNSHFILNYFHDFKQQHLKLPIARVLYATMKNNDIAILELPKTQQQLINAGIQPLKLSERPPQRGEKITVVGIPSEGVKSTLNFLHKSVCRIEGVVTLAEDVYLWPKSLEYRCSIVGGMSGSPIIAIKNHRVVGIVNTAVDDQSRQQPPCSLNRPCEVGRNGQRRIFPDRNYGQLIYHLTTCFNAQGVFNLYQPGCKLEKP